MTNLEVGDIVLCTVDRIVGTIVFVKILKKGEEIEGSIILSEIAPGRIRNLRDYVVPKKKIVCKILNVDKNGNFYLSLRRVNKKEKKEALEKEQHEKSCKSILKTILKDQADKIISEIEKEDSVYDFLQEAKENPKKIEKLVGKEDSKKIIEILKNQKTKKFVVKKEISMKILKSDGLELIKKILNKKDAEIRYISGGKYSIKKEANDLKTADNELKIIISEIEKDAKKVGTEVSIK